MTGTAPSNRRKSGDDGRFGCMWESRSCTYGRPCNVLKRTFPVVAYPGGTCSLQLVHGILVLVLEKSLMAILAAMVAEATVAVNTALMAVVHLRPPPLPHPLSPPWPRRGRRGCLPKCRRLWQFPLQSGRAVCTSVCFVLATVMTVTVGKAVAAVVTLGPPLLSHPLLLPPRRRRRGYTPTGSWL